MDGMKMSSYASYRYNYKHGWRMSLNLNRKTDADIIELLETKKNKQAYIKELIRKDIEENE